MTTRGIELFLESATEKRGGAIGAVAGVVVGALGFWGPLPRLTDAPDLIVAFWLLCAAAGAFVGCIVQGLIALGFRSDDE